MMQAKGVYFTEERFGYDKAQVDSYISRLMQEYQLLLQEHEKTRWYLADAGKAAEEIGGIMQRLRTQMQAA